MQYKYKCFEILMPKGLFHLDKKKDTIPLLSFKNYYYCEFRKCWSKIK